MRAEREQFLEEFIRLEGRGVSPGDPCELCRNEGMYHCIDCLSANFFCEGCMTRVHAFNPFHVIEVSPCILRVIFDDSHTSVGIEMEWPVFREVLSQASRLRPTTRSPSLRLVHKPPEEYQGIHCCPHQRDSPCRPRVLWV